MKFMLSLLVVVQLWGCVARREFIADITDAKLVKIDVVSRYPDTELKRLTWRTEDNIDYITFEPVTSHAAVGDVMRVLTKR